MERYKKIELKDFSKGNGFQFLLGEKNVNASQNVQIDLNSKKIKLTKAFNTKVFYGEATLAHFLKKDDYIYVAYTETTGAAIVKKFTGNNNPATVYTFPVNSYEIYGFWKFKYFLVITVCDPASGAYGKSFFSLDNGASWTDISATKNFGIDSIVEKGDYAYIITRDLTTSAIKLQKTTDFLTFTVIQNIDANDYDGELFILDDIVFFTEQLDGHCKILALENSIFRPVYNEKVNMAYKKTINGRIFFASITKNYVYIREFDGTNFVNIASIYLKFSTTEYIASTQIYVTICDSEIANHIYVILHVYKAGNLLSGVLFSVDLSDGSYFRLNEFTNDRNIVTAILDGDNLHLFQLFVHYVGASSYEFELLNNSVAIFQATGLLESSIIDEGEIVPKQLILRHKPLETGTSVKVYIKKDRASAWSAALITSNTVGSIKKKYNYPAGSIHDFTEFKIELITTDNTKTPEDVQLEFLYLPIGLENAK